MSHHKEIYLQKCQEMGWKVPGIASAAPEHETQCPPFSQNAFLQHLLNFIIADDQVGEVCFQYMLLV